MSGRDGQILILGGQEVRDMLSMQDCINLLRPAMISAIDPASRQPPRTAMPLPGGAGMLGYMPGALADPDCFGAKVISVFHGNFDHGRPSHQGGILLFDCAFGRPVAFIDANEITAIRTAAASALATDLLANPDASVLAILGYGEQAARHLESLPLVRGISEIRIWGRSRERAAAFVARHRAQVGCPIVDVASVEQAVAGADLICTTTASRTPILEGRLLQPGMHLNLVGASVAQAREVDDEAVRRGRLFVDLRQSAEMQAGEYLSALQAGVIGPDHIIGQLGELLDARVPGRLQASDITIYKSLGINAQDLACASFLLERAAHTDRGHWIGF